MSGGWWRHQPPFAFLRRSWLVLGSWRPWGAGFVISRKGREGRKGARRRLTSLLARCVIGSAMDEANRSASSRPSRLRVPNGIRRHAPALADSCFLDAKTRRARRFRGGSAAGASPDGRGLWDAFGVFAHLRVLCDLCVKSGGSWRAGVTAVSRGVRATIPVSSRACRGRRVLRGLWRARSGSRGGSLQGSNTRRTQRGAKAPHQSPCPVRHRLGRGSGDSFGIFAPFASSRPNSGLSARAGAFRRVPFGTRRREGREDSEGGSAAGVCRMGPDWWDAFGVFAHLRVLCDLCVKSGGSWRAGVTAVSRGVRATIPVSSRACRARLGLRGLGPVRSGSASGSGGRWLRRGLHCCLSG